MANSSAVRGQHRQRQPNQRAPLTRCRPLSPTRSDSSISVERFTQPLAHGWVIRVFAASGENSSNARISRRRRGRISILHPPNGGLSEAAPSIHPISTWDTNEKRSGISLLRTAKGRSRPVVTYRCAPWLQRREMIFLSLFLRAFRISRRNSSRLCQFVSIFSPTEGAKGLRFRKQNKWPAPVAGYTRKMSPDFSRRPAQTAYTAWQGIVDLLTRITVFHAEIGDIFLV